VNDLTRDSERIMRESRQSLVENRAGGRHRKAGSIGRGSAEKKRSDLLKMARNIGIATVGIVVLAMVIGVVIGGLGFGGLMTTALILLAAWLLIGMMGRTKTPERSELNKGDPKQMVARTELWLEAQRPALPAPAVQLVDDLGVKLDTLGQQLATAPAGHDAIRDIRELVGDTLPEMVESYTRVPPTMRGEAHAGATADARLVEGLGKISQEIDSINRQLANGALDDLAVQHRYLGYRYGEGPGQDGAAAGQPGEGAN
tara:strand:- start:2001 stop:2774 length:774 start_codon:yes stop_codon:yes gene_type:complete